MGTGTGSYDIDLPDGGQAIIKNNTIIKGPGAENPNMVHFGGEGIPYAGSSITLEGNLLINSNPGAVGLLNHTSVTATLNGNVLDGLPSGALVRGPANATGNFLVDGTNLTTRRLSAFCQTTRPFLRTQPTTWLCLTAEESWQYRAAAAS